MQAFLGPSTINSARKGELNTGRGIKMSREGVEDLKGGFNDGGGEE